eukprot:scaffold273154_cov35-Tisochrysis_lutea.AAC.3
MVDRAMLTSTGKAPGGRNLVVGAVATCMGTAAGQAPKFLGSRAALVHRRQAKLGSAKVCADRERAALERSSTGGLVEAGALRRLPRRPRAPRSCLS